MSRLADRVAVVTGGGRAAVEVSKPVCFVASDAAAGITGQGLNVGGGAVMY